MWFLRRMHISDVVTYSNGTKDLVPMPCVHYQYSLQAATTTWLRHGSHAISW